MIALLTNTKLIVAVFSLWTLFSLVYSIIKFDIEWFQTSGAIMTIGGVLLAARKILRLGLRKFIVAEQIVDGGHFEPTPEEEEAQTQFEKDIQSYKCSIILLIIGTLIWAYGGNILKAIVPGM